jgi:hypothetical protein
MNRELHRIPKYDFLGNRLKIGDKAILFSELLVSYEGIIKQIGGKRWLEVDEATRIGGIGTFFIMKISHNTLSYIEWLKEQVTMMHGSQSKEKELVLKHHFKENDVVVSENYKKMYQIKKVFSSHLCLEDENGKIYGYSNYSDLRLANENEEKEFLKKKLLHILNERPIVSFPSISEIEK